MLNKNSKDTILPESCIIREANEGDAEQLAQIYNFYILNSTATFELTENTTKQMAQKIIDCTNAKLPWLVMQNEENEILGYALASPWKGRCAYHHTLEVSVYLNKSFVTRGLGSVLYQQLIDEITAQDFHTLIAGISLPNDASIALHEKFGFTKVAHFKQVGRKFNQWIDVGYWQLIL